MKLYRPTYKDKATGEVARQNTITCDTAPRYHST